MKDFQAQERGINGQWSEILEFKNSREASTQEKLEEVIFH